MSATESIQIPLIAALVLALAACQAPTAPGASHTLLDFIKQGETRRDAVMLKLGQPSASYEKERILTYRIGEDERSGKYIITPKNLGQWSYVRYSLVLVFDEAGVVKEKSLVIVN